MNTLPAIVVFDIDGTLVDLSEAGKRALKQALADWLGSPSLIPPLSFAGRTDREIVCSVLRRPASDPAFDEVIERYLELLPAEIQRSPYRATPGARELLRELAQQPHVCLGLGTGNVEIAARLKLESAGIDAAFSFGSFGDATDDRTTLVRLALAQAHRQLRATAADSVSFVVGDTPRDVFAAQQAGARAVAVATGPFTLDQLRSCSPEVLVADLAEALRRRFWE